MMRFQIVDKQAFLKSLFSFLDLIYNNFPFLEEKDKKKGY